MTEILLIHDISDAAAADRLADEIAKADVSVAKNAPFTMIHAARAVLVVWSPRSVGSEFVLAWAAAADDEGKLITLRTHDLDPVTIPGPFRQFHTPLVDAWDAIGEAISAKFDAPAGDNRGETQAAEPAAPVPAQEIRQAVTPPPPAPAPEPAPTAMAQPAPAPVAPAVQPTPAAPPVAAPPATSPAAAPIAVSAATQAAIAALAARTTSAAPPPPPPVEPSAPPPAASEGIGAAASAPAWRTEGIGAASDGPSLYDKAWRLERDLGGERDGTTIRFGKPAVPKVITPPPPSLTVDAMQQARGIVLGQTHSEPGSLGEAAAPPVAIQDDSPGRAVPPPVTYRKMNAPAARARTTQEGPLAAQSSSSGSIWIARLALGAVVTGFVYLFRDTIAHNAERMLAILGMAKGVMPPLPAAGIQADSSVDDVDCSVFAPPAAQRGARVMVQVFLHRIEQAERAQFLAETMDDTAKLRGVETLHIPIPRRTWVQVELDGRGLHVSERMCKLLWNGQPTVASFEVEVPVGFDGEVCHPVVRLSVDDEPVGRILFQVRIEVPTRAIGPLPAPVLSGSTAKTYQHAFLSYASKDRAEVLKRAQAFQAAKLSFFQDILSLEPGQRYGEEIMRRIDGSDLFVVFWSRNAMRSEWVQKEIDKALACQRAHPDGLPDIVPIMLEPITQTPPPQALAHLHMNAPINTLIAAQPTSLLQRIRDWIAG